MPPTIGISADSEQEAERLRAAVCAALGWVPVGRPLSPPGRPDRWLARCAPPASGTRV